MVLPLNVASYEARKINFCEETEFLVREKSYLQIQFFYCRIPGFFADTTSTYHTQTLPLA